MENCAFTGSADLLGEGINNFEHTMFIVNPERGMMFGNFLRRIPKHTALRQKLVVASKNSSFWKIADNHGFALGEDHRELGISELPKSINDYLDELGKCPDVEFTRNEIESVKRALDGTFVVEGSEISQNTIGIAGKIRKLIRRK